MLKADTEYNVEMAFVTTMKMGYEFNDGIHSLNRSIESRKNRLLEATFQSTVLCNIQ